MKKPKMHYIASVCAFTVSVVLVVTSAIIFDRYDNRRIELDKFYAQQGYSQLYGETKQAVMIRNEYMEE